MSGLPGELLMSSELSGPPWAAGEHLKGNCGGFRTNFQGRSSLPSKHMNGGVPFPHGNEKLLSCLCLFCHKKTGDGCLPLLLIPKE